MSEIPAAAVSVFSSEQVSDDVMSKVHHIDHRITAEGDPAHGKWVVDSEAPITVWTDASSIALGVALQIEDDVIEDAAWLRPKDDSTHINRAELDAVLRGINLALKWGTRKLRVMCDSVTVCGWLTAVIERTHNVKTTALGEILIRRRLDTLREIIDQENLEISVQFVRSSENVADPLTRVPKIWLSGPKVANTVAGSAIANVGLDDVRAIHEKCHFGVDRTLELARECYGEDNVSKRMVRKVVTRCHQCSRIDPAATYKWDKGTIAAADIWECLAADITHYKNRPYLTVTDVASRFTIWRELRNESSLEVKHLLNQIVAEFGPPKRFLSDNGTVFRSREVTDMLDTWSIEQILSCAYRHCGNGVAERCHRTVKRTACRTGHSIAEAIFWVNNTRGNHAASPYELLFGATSRKPGIATDRKTIERTQVIARTPHPAEDHYRDCERNPFVVGTRVYLRTPHGRCDVPWTGPHTITAIRSNVSVELDDDGVSRHVSHVRSVPDSNSNQSPDDAQGVAINVTDVQGSDIDSDNRNCPAPFYPRQSGRDRKRPIWWNDYET